MRAPSPLVAVVGLMACCTLVLAKPARPAKARARKPATAPQRPPPPAASEGPTVDGVNASPEDIDVSRLPAPKPAPATKAQAVADRPVSGDDGGHFRFRAHLAFARFQYDEQGGPAPVSLQNLYVGGGLEVSRPILSGWILGAAVDSPLLTLENAGAVNFGPLFARFSVGHELRLGARWDGEVYLSYLFETPVGRRGASGFSRLGGVQGLFRGRYHQTPTRTLEVEVSVAFLDARQDGFKSGDRTLAMQLAYFFRSTSGQSGLGPFIAADETKAQFPDRRTAGGRVRLGLLAEF